MSFSSFQKLTGNRLKLGLYLLAKLPSAYLCGVRLRSLNEECCTTSVPYKWLSQNPFRSTYFACQAMAAEMSTGLLAMGHTYKSRPAISMLVVQMEAQFFKKAIERIYFTCDSGPALRNAIERSKATGEGQTVTCTSNGRNKGGDLISTFRITWSFKARR